MPNVVSPSMMAKYLEALSQDEDSIAEAAAQYEAAKSALDVGLLRYVALRDFLKEQLGMSPYARDVEWPSRYTEDGWPIERGRYRFSGMSVGDAVLEVLSERFEEYRKTIDQKYNKTNQWMTLAQIIAALSNGGMGFPEPVSGRAVNAALLKTQGIKVATLKSSGEKVYSFNPQVEEDKPEKGETDLDDVPFDQ